TTVCHTLSLHDALPIFEEDAAEAVDVGAPVDVAALAPLLRRHVRRRAEQAPRLRVGGDAVVEELGEAEVDELDELAVEHARDHRSEEHTSELQSRENLV